MRARIIVLRRKFATMKNHDATDMTHRTTNTIQPRKSKWWIRWSKAHLTERFRAIAPTSTRRRGNGTRLCRLGLRGILLHGATYWLLFGQIEIDGNQGIPRRGFATLLNPD